MTIRQFTVPGKPVPQGSMKAFVTKGKAFTTASNPGPLAVYRNDIRNTYDHLFGTEPMLEGTISINIDFVFARPQSHYNTAGSLKGSTYKTPAPRWHAIKPDIDKLVRAALDALSLYAFDDDAQVCYITATKSYDTSPSTSIILEEISER